MNYAVLMAALDLDLPPHGVFTACARLAEIFHARTIGVAAGECTISPYFADGPVADTFIADCQSEVRSQLRLLGEQFRNALAARSDAIEWRSAERLPDRFIKASARAADLIVAGRPNTSGNLMRGPDIASLLMQAGRPVLVVAPEVTRFSAKRILVAWKDTREARRAASDALPLLRKAAEVHVLTVDEPAASGLSSSSCADDVANWLGRHGVKATVIVRPDYGNVGKSIEECAGEVNADIIVAGAFGHSRFMEWLLGGVTRHLLLNARMNVLLSH